MIEVTLDCVVKKNLVKKKRKKQIDQNKMVKGMTRKIIIEFFSKLKIYLTRVQ